MTDIVERLRDLLKLTSSPHWHDTMKEAADEIERLRKALTKIAWSANPRHEIHNYAELLGDIRCHAHAALAKEIGHE